MNLNIAFKFPTILHTHTQKTIPQWVQHQLLGVLSSLMFKFNTNYWVLSNLIFKEFNTTYWVYWVLFSLMLKAWSWANSYTCLPRSSMPIMGACLAHLAHSIVGFVLLASLICLLACLLGLVRCLLVHSFVDRCQISITISKFWVHELLQHQYRRWVE